MEIGIREGRRERGENGQRKGEGRERIETEGTGKRKADDVMRASHTVGTTSYCAQPFPDRYCS